MQQQRAQLLTQAREAGAILAQHNEWAETHGRLHPAALQALVQAQVPRLFLPTALEGLAVDPVTCALVCEVLADADPSAAWYVMVYNSARMLGAHWPQSMVRALWQQQPDALVAASGYSPATGIRQPGGVLVSGRNSFVSGCHHADYMLTPVLIDGAPHMAAVAADRCHIEDNWNPLGMRGTGSDDVTVHQAFVPDELIAPAGGARNALYDDMLYQCPARVVFASYVPVALSLARRALDFLAQLALDKIPYASAGKLAGRSVAQIHYGKALAIYRSARGYFLDTLQDFWERANAGEEFSSRDRADLYLAGTHAMQASSTVVRHVVDAAGSTSFDANQPLARIARDMETLRHHGFANESRYGSVAQVHWGAELDYPLLLR